MKAFDNYNYQIKILQPNGVPVPNNSSVKVRATLLLNNVVYFQEVHQVTGLVSGVTSIALGSGVNTGLAIFNSIRDISPYPDSLRLSTEVDVNNTGYVQFDNSVIYSIPFSIFSLRSLDTLEILRLQDVNFSLPSLNSIFKFNNSYWHISNDSVGTTTLYSHTSNSAGFTDTATFAYMAVQMNTDTAVYAFTTDSALFASSANSAMSSDSSNYSVLAANADSIIDGWHLKGERNNPPNILGTKDNVAMLFKTNNAERIRINSSGNVNLNGDTAKGNLNIKGINGFLYQGAIGNSIWQNSINGSVILFSASKGSLMMGEVNDTRWNDTTLMAKSAFAFGKNVLSDGGWSSIVFGDSCIIKAVPPPTTYAAFPWFTSGLAAFALGKNCVSTGAYGISMGYASEAQMVRNVALGYKCKTSKESASIAVGYQAETKGSTASSFGYKTLASGHKSMALGTLASTNGHSGSFVFGDASTIGSNDTIKNTTINQFMARASGGVIFYTDTLASTGVSLAAGSGSWSNLSDSCAKENFKSISYFQLIRKLNEGKIFTWNYISQESSILHMGPTAQTFKRIFGLGENDFTINQTDADGIVLASINGLNSRIDVLQLDEKAKSIKAQLKELTLEDASARLNKIEKLLIISDTNK